MKKLGKIVLVVAVALVQVCLSPAVYAAKDAAALQAELLAAKKAELNNHEWEVRLTPTTGKGAPMTDVLIFKGQQFESENMTKKGYKPTNYTVSLQEGGPTVWETMQSTESGQPVFWRGEWEGMSMKGVMSKQLGEGKNEDYYFSSLGSKEIKEEPKVEEPAPAVEEDAAPAETIPAEEAAIEEKAPEVPAAAPVESVPAAPKKKKWGF